MHTEQNSSKSTNKRLQCCDWRTKLFYQPVKNDLRTYDNIWKIASTEGDDYTIGLLDYPYFKEYYRLIAIDLCK